MRCKCHRLSVLSAPGPRRRPGVLRRDIEEGIYKEPLGIAVESCLPYLRRVATNVTVDLLRGKVHRNEGGTTT